MTNSLKFIFVICAMGMYSPSVELGSGAPQDSQLSVAASSHELSGRGPLHYHLRAPDIGNTDTTVKLDKGVNLSGQEIGIYLSLTRLLHANPVDVNARDESSKASLHCAAKDGHTPVVLALLEYPGIEVNLQDADGRTSLHFATQNNHVPVMRLLLNARANINATDSNNRTPLHLAAQNGNTQAAQLLFERGARLTVRDKNSAIPAQLAMINDHRSVMELLLQERSADQARLVYEWLKMFPARDPHN